MIRFRMEWQDAPGVRDTVLARTWRRLVIEAGGRLVTQAIDSRSESVRGGVYGSAFPPARLGRRFMDAGPAPTPHVARNGVRPSRPGLLRGIR